MGIYSKQFYQHYAYSNTLAWWQKKLIRIKDYSYIWTKTDDEGNPDEIWNQDHSYSQKTIEITQKDVFRRAQNLNVMLSPQLRKGNLKMGIISSGQITITDLSDAPVLSAFITASQTTTQVYDQTTNGYNPSYAGTHNS